jgi:hypothetical protein
MALAVQKGILAQRMILFNATTASIVLVDARKLAQVLPLFRKFHALQGHSVLTIQQLQIV